MSLHVQKIVRITIMATYAALVFALKEFLDLALIGGFNVEVVTFLLSFSSLVFPLFMSLTISLTFNLCEILLRGLSSWAILYFVAWPLLVIIIWMLKKIIKKQWWIFIILNSLWGFSFGTLDSLIHLLMYGKADFYMYWINGLPFDAIHGIGNFMIATLLYKPISKIWDSRLKYYVY